MRKIDVKESFLKDLETIYNYVENEFGKIYIYKIQDSLENYMSLLSLFPLMGKPTINESFYMFKFSKNWIYYKFSVKKK